MTAYNFFLNHSRRVENLFGCILNLCCFEFVMNVLHLQISWPLDSWRLTSRNVHPCCWCCSLIFFFFFFYFFFFFFCGLTVGPCFSVRTFSNSSQPTSQICCPLYLTDNQDRGGALYLPIFWYGTNICLCVGSFISRVF